MNIEPKTLVKVALAVLAGILAVLLLSKDTAFDWDAAQTAGAGVLCLAVAVLL